MALGETQVMAATKRDLAAAGVDVDKLEASAGAGADKAAVPRSADTLLVKNLPYATEAADLEVGASLRCNTGEPQHPGDQDGQLHVKGKLLNMRPRQHFALINRRYIRAWHTASA